MQTLGLQAGSSSDLTSAHKKILFGSQSDLGPSSLSQNPTATLTNHVNRSKTGF